MEPFLSHVASHILEAHKERTAQLAIVFPNQRANLFLKDHLQKKIDKPLWVPRIYGIEEFLEEVSQLKIIGNVDLLFEFYHVYCAVEKDKAEEFGDFIQWAQVLLHDFNELDQQLVDAEEFFNYLHEVRKIETWNTMDEELTSLQKNYLNFWKNAKKYYAALRAHLHEQNKAYNGLASRIAAENIQQYISNQLSYRKIIFAGFNAMTHAEEIIIQSLGEVQLAEVLWDADAYYMNDKAQEAGLFLRNHKKNWKLDAFNWITNDFTSQKKKIEVIGVAQNIGQAKLAGNLLKSIGKDENLQHTAVVLANEDLLQPVLLSIPSNCEEVNVTMGNKLVNASIAGLFEALIDLCVNFLPKGYYHNDILKLIRQKYFLLLFSKNEQVELTAFATAIQQKNIVYLTKGDFPELLLKNKFIHSIINIDGTVQLLAYFREIVLHLKSQFIEFDNKVYKMELEYLLSFYQLINRYIDLTDKYPFINSFKTLKSLFKSSMASEKLDFKGEPLSGLQIMGMLETRNLDFKTIILLSVNEGTLPAGKTHQTFIPYDVKKKYKLPSYREKDAMYAYHFYRLIQKAENIYLVYNTETDEFGSGEKSRFITQMQDELKPFDNIEWHDKIATIPIETNGSTTIHIEKNKGLLQKITSFFLRGVSPTAISSYINCPLDFYYRYLLELKEEEAVEETIEANSLGSVIHDVLEKMFKPFENKVITPDDIKEMLTKTREFTETSFLTNFSIENLRYGKNFLSLEVAVNYINEFLKKEYEFISRPKNTILIKAVEQRVEYDIDLDVNGQVVPVRLLGKIDRIDEVNGVTRIIDYKSGNAENREFKLDSIDQLFSKKQGNKALQVMMYAYLYMKNQPSASVQSGIISFRKLSSGFMNLNLNKETLISDAILTSFESELKTQLEAILSPSSPFYHLPESIYCRFCHE